MIRIELVKREISVSICLVDAWDEKNRNASRSFEELRSLFPFTKLIKENDLFRYSYVFVLNLCLCIQDLYSLYLRFSEFYKPEIDLLCVLSISGSLTRGTCTCDLFYNC